MSALVDGSDSEFESDDEMTELDIDSSDDEDDEAETPSTEDPADEENENLNARDLRAQSRRKRHDDRLARAARTKEWGGAFRMATSSGMGRGLHRLFKTVAAEIRKDKPDMGEPGSEVAPFIPEPRNFSEVCRLPAEVRKPCPRATHKEIKNLIDNRTFALEDPNPEETATTCMDVYKANIQSDGTIDKLKLRIVVIGDFQNKDVMGDTWSPTASLRTVKYFLADAARHKARIK